MDRTRPLWELHLIEGLADGRVALYAKVHHAMFDGVAAMNMMQPVLSSDPHEQRPPLWAQERRRTAEREADPTCPHQGLLERALKVGAEIVPGVQQRLARARRRRDARGPTRRRSARRRRCSTSRSPARAASPRSRSRSSAFKAIGKAVGATVNDVTLAVCAGALRRYLLAQNALPDRPLIAMVPVSLRSADQDGGNQLAILLANLGDASRRSTRAPAARRRLDDVAKERLAQMSQLERLAHAAAMSAPMGASMVTGHARRHPIYNVVISNVPGPKHTLYLDGMRLDESYPVSIPVDYLALNITITGYGDDLGFGYIACRRSVPALQRMLDHTDESLLELEARGSADHGGCHAAPVSQSTCASLIVGRSSIVPNTIGSWNRRGPHDPGLNT